MFVVNGIMCFGLLTSYLIFGLDERDKELELEPCRECGFDEIGYFSSTFRGCLYVAIEEIDIAKCTEKRKMRLHGWNKKTKVLQMKVN